MKIYQKPKIEICRYGKWDVITASGAETTFESWGELPNPFAKEKEE